MIWMHRGSRPDLRSSVLRDWQIIAMQAQFKKIRVVALSRQILELTAELETISRHKAGTSTTITTQEARSEPPFP